MYGFLYRPSVLVALLGNYDRFGVGSTGAVFVLWPNWTHSELLNKDIKVDANGKWCFVFYEVEGGEWLVFSSEFALAQ